MVSWRKPRWRTCILCLPIDGWMCTCGSQRAALKIRNNLPLARSHASTTRQESNYRRQPLRSAHAKRRRRVVGPYACLYCSQLFGILLGSIWIGRLGLLREQCIQPHSWTTSGFAKHRNFMGPRPPMWRASTKRAPVIILLHPDLALTRFLRAR